VSAISSADSWMPREALHFGGRDGHRGVDGRFGVGVDHPLGDFAPAPGGMQSNPRRTPSSDRAGWMPRRSGSRPLNQALPADRAPHVEKFQQAPSSSTLQVVVGDLALHAAH
jgi:hypothetical protein